MKKLYQIMTGLLLTAFIFLGSTAAASAAGRVDWSWSGTNAPSPLVNPYHMEMLDNGNLLISNYYYYLPSVLEVDRRREVVWSYSEVLARAASRTKNGCTLLVDGGEKTGRAQVQEITSQGEVSWSLDTAGYLREVEFIQELPLNRIMLGGPHGLVEVTRDGTATWRYQAGEVLKDGYTYRIKDAEPLSNGNFLVAEKRLYSGGRVLEITRNGQVVWSYGNGTEGTGPDQLANPVAVSWTDGVTSVVDFSSRRTLQIDEKGKVLWVINWGDTFTGSRSNPQQLFTAVPLASGHTLVSVMYSGMEFEVLEINDRDPSIGIYFNDYWLFTDVPPVMEKGRVLVPLRVIFEALGARVDWDNETQTVTAVKEGRTVALVIGEKEVQIDEEKLKLDVPAQMREGRTLVPIRFVSEAFWAEVDWNEPMQEVLINTEE